MKTLEELTQLLIKFRNDRDWSQFHNSKDLALALSIEAAELNELFLWKSEKEAENINKVRLGEELADVLAYALLLAEKNDLNIEEIVRNKINLNAGKYPIHKAKGTSEKYTEL
ncbi:nucleotide pyrophosphohydrolase [bacterium]|nr:nucleotide pyrophosphohydrolase [bacterium]NCQ54914.1 nucleotide pyrophosphohydrolase [Candidatus Parcubacteria bacterium]NCS66958.1 nucleotide pyrophosphohydrolase [Candidatus Peregrinibacteria bacterium]NCS95904.1 nucleotide pyrophosphohydrolase [bacterium]